MKFRGSEEVEIVMFLEAAVSGLFLRGENGNVSPRSRASVQFNASVILMHTDSCCSLSLDV